jgi:hypothetical protein
MNNGERTPPARARPVQPPPLPLRIRRPNNRRLNLAADPFAGIRNAPHFQMNPGGSPGRRRGRKTRKGRKNRSKKTRKN